MKHPTIPSIGLTVLAGISLVTPASATISIDYVTVGNAGKAADTSDGDGGTSGIQRYGAVSYTYNIGKYEVTNSQYVDFLNAKAVTDTYSLYNTNMSDYGITRANTSGSYNYSVTGGLGNRPVVYVNWFDAARFSNWLGNGQGSGDTETGAYNLLGAVAGTGISVQPGAQVWIPSEDEWYKAAYFNGGTSTYSLYPNGQNSITTADANYSSSASKNVGSYSGDPSSYGTFDQGGNVWEWNDAIISGSMRGARGGCWDNFNHLDEVGLRSSSRFASSDPAGENNIRGFRVASVPEPSCLVLTMFASGMMLTRRKR